MSTREETIAAIRQVADMIESKPELSRVDVLIQCRGVADALGTRLTAGNPIYSVTDDGTARIVER